MSRVNALTKARGNLSVKFMEFTRVASKEKYAVFFEGEDEKYYSIRINSIRPDIRWSGINCGGKENVVELREKIRGHKTYSNAPCMFFVDADFDDNSTILEFHDVYVTPCYSVENLYISSEAFTRILSAEFGISDSLENESCYTNAIALFEKIKSAYIAAIKPFNCLFRELRLMEKYGDLKGSLNINNIKLEYLVKINLESVEKVYNERNPKLLFPDLADDFHVDLEPSEMYFNNLPGELWFRGKQNLEFFRVFLENIKAERCKKSSRKIFQSRGNVKLQISKSNCISELSQYADTPPCLKNFLERQAEFNSAA
ncbi:DUF4435 domain-containing protein [Vibrio cholerae]|uniref:DUF4435 domain-containing protein n=1 Tax=Vibrio cholerae TaxID=666 RepID=UPI0000F34B6D|nr:DUF4435 domain-containing protein [Vibrio cholerae]APF78967.1 hypothetical protein ASZ85_01437 [Vibrio cholerae]APF82921.1 hypothetical protein ASZ86_01497 [Vibrio cholerae]EAZ74123.1 group-specific protein, putative [Vibrio cholerae NCTC 8457]